jgi:hypothetical protein
MSFEEITKKMNELYQRKNQDYGNSFDNTLDEFGIVAGLIRINDKVNRLKSIYKSSEVRVNDERIEDTLMDLANYAVMSLQWLTKNK